jgi:hypothetical protein
MCYSRRRSISGTFSLVVLALSCPAFAASQGSIGSTSSGAVRISVSIQAPARVSGLSDVAFDADGTGDATVVTQNLCIKGASHTYTVAASGSGPAGTLSLSNGDKSIAYRVGWLPQGELDSDAHSSQLPVAVQAAASPADCAREQGSGQLRIAIGSADSAGMPANGPYTGSLVLMLSPE